MNFTGGEPPPPAPLSCEERGGSRLVKLPGRAPRLSSAVSPPFPRREGGGGLGPLPHSNPPPDLVSC